MTHQGEGGPLGPLAISLIRTWVPIVWGYAIAWLIHFGLPASLLTNYQDVIITGLGAVVTALWYALWRWAETKIPSLDSWAGRLLVILALGHPSQPTYGVETPIVPGVPPAGG
jgi:hypothetical protein